MTASLNHQLPVTPDLTSRKVAIKSKPDCFGLIKFWHIGQTWD